MIPSIRLPRNITVRQYFKMARYMKSRMRAVRGARREAKGHDWGTRYFKQRPHTKPEVSIFPDAVGMRPQSQKLRRDCKRQGIPVPWREGRFNQKQETV